MDSSIVIEPLKSNVEGGSEERFTRGFVGVLCQKLARPALAFAAICACGLHMSLAMVRIDMPAQHNPVTPAPMVTRIQMRIASESDVVMSAAPAVSSQKAIVAKKHRIRSTTKLLKTRALSYRSKSVPSREDKTADRPKVNTVTNKKSENRGVSDVPATSLNGDPIELAKRQKVSVPVVSTMKSSVGGVSLRGYGRHIVREIGRHKVYPSVAKARKQEGRVILSVSVDHTGQLSGVPRIKVSSGFRALDQAATEIVKRSGPFGTLPRSESGAPRNAATFVVPVNFTLQDA